MSVAAKTPTGNMAGGNGGNGGGNGGGTGNNGGGGNDRVPPSSASGGQPAISSLNVLLPYCERQTTTEYRLEAYNGCFKWLSTKSNVASITPLYEDSNNPSCSQSAIISVTADQSSRQKTLVLAEDLASGKLLRCEVYVDKIKRIEVTHTTKNIYVDDMEELGIQAFDAEDNLFSTVEGLRVAWSIQRSKNNTKYKDAKGILHLVSYKDANIKVSSAKEALAESGEYSSSTLVRGMKTGVATVQAVLDETTYKSVAPASVDLSVFQPLLLLPYRPTYIFTGQEIQYILLTKKANIQNVVKMPSSRYQWSIEDTKVASVSSRAVVSGKVPGISEVMVTDLDMPENEARSIIHVANDGFLTLTVYPIDPPASKVDILASNTSVPNNKALPTWHLVESQEYEIDVQCYTADGHWYNTSSIDLDLKWNLDPSQGVVAVQSSSANERGRYPLTILGDGSQRPSVRLQVSLQGFRNKISGSYKKLQTMTAVHGITVTSPVQIVETLSIRDGIILPFDGENRHQINLQAIGGSGEYYWRTGDVSIASINQHALLTSEALGHTIVVVQDRRNPSNADQQDVDVKIPHSLKFEDSIVETQVDTVLNLSVIALDADGKMFSSCRALELQWLTDDTSIFLEDGKATALIQANAPVHYCGQSSLRALRKGHTTVQVIHSHGPVRAKITVAGYPPLKAVTPSGTNRILMTPGASVTVHVQGGPAPWPFDPEAHEERLDSDATSVLRITKLEKSSSEDATGADDVNSYGITCLAYGEETISVFVGNLPSHTNPVPGNASTQILFACKQPHVLMIVPERTRNVSEQCGIATGSDKSKDGTNNKFVFRNNRVVTLNAIVLDKQGRTFDNYSSTPVRWVSNNKELTTFGDDESNEDTSVRLLNVADGTGVTIVQAHIDQFSTSVLSSVGLSASQFSLSKQINHQIEIKFVENVRVIPDHISVFFHVNNSVEMNTTGGSGFFLFETAPSQVVNLSMGQGGKSAIVRPLHIGSTDLAVNDECLQISDEASSKVVVSRVNRLQVSVRDKLLLGSSIELRLRVLDANGNPFRVDQFPFMQIESHSDTSCVSLALSSNGNKPGDHEAVYTVYGVSLGTARITFTASGNDHGRGQTVTSGQHQVSVYPPLAIKPIRMILIPGATHQVSHSGGPYNARMSYTSEDDGIASVDARGMVFGHRVGTTTILVKAHGYDSLSGDLIVYGQDQVQVVVKKITGLAIRAESDVLDVGQNMVVRVHGISGETPYTFGLASIPFRWFLTNTEMADLKPVYHKSGVSLDMPSQFSIVISGKRVGSGNLNVRVDGATKNDLGNFTDVPLHQLIDTMPFHVVEPLRLTSPQGVLLPPNSVFTVTTNKDHIRRLTYSVAEDAKSGSNVNIVSVDSQGTIRTGEMTGTSFVIIRDQTGAAVMVKVQVKPVWQLSLHPDAPHLVEVPINELAQFQLVLRDDHGVPFNTHAGVHFVHDRNHLQIVGDMMMGTENKTVSFRALQQGQAIVRVYMHDAPKIECYVKIVVGGSILPMAPVVHVGGEIQFVARGGVVGESQSSLSGSTGSEEQPSQSSVKWYSQDSNVVEIDADTGKAYARAPGKTVVSFNGTKESSTAVEVVGVHRIWLDMGKTTYVTNVISSRAGSKYGGRRSSSSSSSSASSSSSSPVYRFQINIQDQQGRALINSLSVNASESQIDHNMNIGCEVEEREWASSHVEVDRHRGTTWCVVRPITVSRQNLSRPVENLRLRAWFISSHLDAEEAQGSVSVSAGRQWEDDVIVPFVPGFVLENRGRPIVFNNRVQKSHLRVYGKPSQIEASSSDPNKVSVRSMGSQSTSNSIVFELVVKDTARSFNKVYIEFTNLVTGQVERVRVGFNNGDGVLVMETDNGNDSDDEDEDDGEHRSSGQVQVIYSGDGESSTWTYVAVIAGVVIVWAFIRYCRKPIKRPNNRNMFSPIKGNRSLMNVSRRHNPSDQSGNNTSFMSAASNTTVGSIRYAGDGDSTIQPYEDEHPEIF